MGEFEQYRATLSDYELLRSANCCRHAFEYQQSKIEQLEKQISDLQYRVDSTLSEISRAVNCCESIETECVLVEIKEILRGES